MPPCVAVRQDGQSCRARAINNGNYCFFHSPNSEHVRQRKRGRRSGGVSRRRKQVLLPTDALIQLETPHDVTALMASVLSGLLSGDLDPRTSNAATVACGVILNSMSAANVGATSVEFIVHAPTDPIPHDPDKNKISQNTSGASH